MASKLGSCRACGKEAARNASKCPHCGQRSPVPQSFKAAKIVGVIAGSIFAVGICAAWFSDYSASSAFAIGNSYQVLKAGPLCRTIEGFSQAVNNGVIYLDEARKYGCTMIGFGDRVAMVAKNAELVKVRVITGSDQNNFEGWTDSAYIEQPAPR
ncbi:MAG: hypothetical protein IVW54_14150 [Candidatus Binataceae bacterium]|nr:hypothetical protein [Candidatus Binataceae bacterium]